MKNQQFFIPTSPTQTSLHSHRRGLEAYNFGFKENSDCTICVAKTKEFLFLHMQIVGFLMLWLILCLVCTRIVIMSAILSELDK